MLNICICDDEEKDICYCRDLILSIMDKEEVNISSFNSGESLLFNIEEEINIFDVIFMDIEMKKLNGINAMKLLREKGYTGDVVYLTSISDYVFDSFETNPVNYLLKNEKDIDKFKKVLDIVIKNSQKREDDYIIISKNNNQYKLNKREIVFIESKGRKIYIHMENGQIHDCYMKLSEVMDYLGEYVFVRVHRSFIINYTFIIKLKNNLVILKNNLEIPIGRSYIREIQNYISNKLT